MPRARQHGGRRQGEPGGQYTNRKDMQQGARAVPGQVYGEAGAQIAAQQAVPLPRQAPAPGTVGSPAAQGPSAGAPLTPMDAPSQRPGEPLTTGIASGAGPGPEVLHGTPGPPEDPTLATLKGILARYPNQDLQALVAQASARHP